MNTVTQERINQLLDSAETQEHVFWSKELIVSYRLSSGFTISGRAACVDPANFDLDKGRAIARKDAEQQLWQLEGYLLQHRIAGTAAMSAAINLGETVMRFLDTARSLDGFSNFLGRVQTGENSYVDITTTPSETIEAIFQKQGDKIFLIPSPSKDTLSRSGALIENSFSIAQYDPKWTRYDVLLRSQRYRVTVMDSFKPLGKCCVIKAEEIDE